MAGIPDVYQLFLGAISPDGVREWSHVLIPYDQAGPPGRTYAGSFGIHADGTVLSTWGWSSSYGGGFVSLELPDGTVLDLYDIVPMLVALGDDGTFLWWDTIANADSDVAIGPEGVIYTLEEPAMALASHPEGTKLGYFGFEGALDAFFTDIAAEGSTLYLAGEHDAPAEWGHVELVEDPDLPDGLRNGFVIALDVAR